MLWHKKCPFKIAFVIWKVMRHKIVVDSIRGRYNLTLAPKCDRNIYPCLEDEEHLFMNSPTGKVFWKYFSRLFGIRMEQRNIRQCLIIWWMVRDHNTVHKLTLQIFLGIIMWQIWKSRCKYRFEGLKMSTSKIIIKVTQQTSSLPKQFPMIPPFMKWIHFFEHMEKAKIKTTIVAVR